MAQFDELLTRGVEKIYPSREALEAKLTSGERIKIYFGIDPTGPSLHIGHAVNLLKLREFQDLGHEIILLIGDFTAMIGDPTDKAAARSQLSREQVEENMRAYLDQAGKILDLQKTTVRYNSDWLAKLTLTDVLALSSKLTFAQLIKRDMFQQRLAENKDLFLHEFLYPLMQGYDSVALEVDLEIGGNDQMFNMLVGRDLMKSLKQKEKLVMTGKLLVDPTGKKMGKSEGNMVALADSAPEMYGKVMSWPDSLLPLGFEICTRLPLAENLALAAADPKTAKMKLAREIVRLYHGEESAAAAEAEFVQTFQNKAIPNELLELRSAVGDKLAEVLTANQIVESKSEFRRLVEGGAIHNLDANETITDPDFQIKTALTLKVGKRRFVKIIIEN